jgi:glucose-6-phosphate dehydrogenase assembly protein OpcA
VILEITGKKEKASTPYLLLGWLSSVLNWKLVDKKDGRFTFQKIQKGTLVEAEIKTLPSREQKSVLVGLMLSSESPAMKLHVSFVQERACVSWMSASEGSENKCQEISLKIPDEAHLFSEELQILKRDRVYEDSLTQAASLCRD